VQVKQGRRAGTGTVRGREQRKGEETYIVPTKRKTAELLQQFCGFIFFDHHLLSDFSAMRHTRSCPAALIDQHSVCIILGTLSVASLRYFPGEYHLWRWVFNF